MNEKYKNLNSYQEAVQALLDLVKAKNEFEKLGGAASFAVEPGKPVTLLTEEQQTALDRLIEAEDREREKWQKFLKDLRNMRTVRSK